MFEGRIADESGLASLVSLLAIHHVAVSAEQLRHEVGHFNALRADDLVRIARRLPGVRAKRIAARWDDLDRLPLPAIADGPSGWFLIGRAMGEEVLIQRPGEDVAKISRAALDQMWNGDLVLVTTRESARVSQRGFDVSWFLPQIVRYRRLIGEVLLITFVLNLLGLAAPLFFQAVVDKVLVHQAVSTLAVLAIGFVAVSLWETAFGWLRTRLYSETSQKIDVELGARLFRHLLALPMGFFEKRRVGDTVMRVRQLETIREFLTNASLTVLIEPLFAVVFLVAMALYSLKLFLISLVALPLFFIVAFALTGPLRRRIDEKFERGAANNALLVESIGGIQTIKAAAVEPQWRERWERQLAGYSLANQRVIDLSNTGSQAIQLISKLNTAALLYFGALAVMNNELTVGGLVAFNMFAQRVAAPVIRMAQLWQDFQQVRMSVDRLGDILNQPAEPAAASAAALPALRGSIRFEDVRFRYDKDGPWTLDGVTLDVAAGTTLGIVGSSGSGKSTLTKLLQRLYLPEQGRVLVDGIDIGQIDPAWLRRQIGVVLQENILFNRSVRDNIAIANPAMPVEQVIAAAELAGAHDFIGRMPQGYDTIIEERGSNLSGGQRQRLAIARALSTSPRVLIFDEATSALDAESEEIVQNNLAAIAKGRTVIIIAHRLSAIRQCDQIAVIERGSVADMGSWHELVHREGRFRDLHQRQIGVSGGVAA